MRHKVVPSQGTVIEHAAYTATCHDRQVFKKVRAHVGSSRASRREWFPHSIRGTSSTTAATISNRTQWACYMDMSLPEAFEDLMETLPVIFTKEFSVLVVSDTKDKTQPQMKLPTRLALIRSGRTLSCFSVIINTAILVLSTMLHQDGVTSDGDGSRPRLQGDCG